MKGLTEYAIDEMFRLGIGCNYFVSFYEIYGGRCFDLLNGGRKVQILEDGNNEVQIFGLIEKQARSQEEMQYIMNYGHNARTTHSTLANDTSSRSHAVCQIRIESDYFESTKKLILCDLAGSERAGDCQSNSRERRIEGAEINKSLLSLKECIRAMESNNRE